MSLKEKKKIGGTRISRSKVLKLLGQNTKTWKKLSEKLKRKQDKEFEDDTESEIVTNGHARSTTITKRKTKKKKKKK